MDFADLFDRFTFVDGTVMFSGRMIETDNYNASRARGSLLPTVSLSAVGPNDW